MAGVIVLVLLIGAAGGVFVWFRGALGSIPIRDHCTATASGSTTELSPEQAGNAAIIAGIALKRKLPARAASIGIATAIQESKLENIDYGDRDSLGLFQQRPSQGWGTTEQIMDPVYATNAFYDELIKVEGYEAMAITDVAQKVQRSAFPDAYADHEPEARIFASALSGYSEAALSCVLHGSSATVAQTVQNGTTPRARAVATAATAELDDRLIPLSGSDDGTTLTYRFTSADANRTSWSLAQWAVSRASGLDVVRVAVDGRVWNRDHGPDGWTSDFKAAAGTVTIRVS